MAEKDTYAEGFKRQLGPYLHSIASEGGISDEERRKLLGLLESTEFTAYAENFGKLALMDNPPKSWGETFKDFASYKNQVMLHAKLPEIGKRNIERGDKLNTLETTLMMLYSTLSVMSVHEEEMNAHYRGDTA